MTDLHAPIDLRSDTVTQPTDAMRAAMLAAPLGDDVYGDDPTVNRLQSTLAERLGFEAGLFCSSGTQSNLVALMTHCQRGDEYIAGQDAHCYRWEAGGAAVLGSIQPQPIENAADGSLPLAKIEANIKSEDVHFARTKLLALENTIGGKVLPQDYVEQAIALAQRHGLQRHLDGARFFNAAVATHDLSGGAETLNQTERRLLRGFDSASICLSKGLGAPVGSVLLGNATFIHQARHWRKMLGGGMRQAGVLAAAGLYALDHHVERLSQDHAHARRLADALQGMDGLAIEPVQTNMLFLQVAPEKAAAFIEHLKAHDILVTGLYSLRMVLHLGISSAQVERVIEVTRKFFG
ncbi:MAG: low-specificity L-threonine aldolase [Comamonadaceae bacterium]|nr:MAG: low-specificity L-threonine aldolase [Comamonadaceae bacterium]